MRPHVVHGIVHRELPAFWHLLGWVSICSGVCVSVEVLMLARAGMLVMV
jgi:hypothetical protein